MKTLFPVAMEAELIIAPLAVQQAFQRTNEFFAWALGPLGLRPTEQGLADCFWATFRDVGATMTDFEWMLAGGFCTEDDRSEVL